MLEIFCFVSESVHTVSACNIPGNTGWPLKRGLSHGRTQDGGKRDRFSCLYVQVLPSHTSDAATSACQVCKHIAAGTRALCRYSGRRSAEPGRGRSVHRGRAQLPEGVRFQAPRALRPLNDAKPRLLRGGELPLDHHGHCVGRARLDHLEDRLRRPHAQSVSASAARAHGSMLAGSQAGGSCARSHARTLGVDSAGIARQACPQTRAHTYARTQVPWAQTLSHAGQRAHTCEFSAPLWSLLS